MYTYTYCGYDTTPGSHVCQVYVPWWRAQGNVQVYTLMNTRLASTPHLVLA